MQKFRDTWTKPFYERFRMDSEVQLCEVKEGLFIPTRGLCLCVHIFVYACICVVCVCMCACIYV